MAIILKNSSANYAYVNPKQFDIASICESLTIEDYACFNGFLPEDLLCLLYEEAVQFEKEQLLQIAGVGRGEDYGMNLKIRRDKIKWFDSSGLAQIRLWKILEDLRLKINQNLMLGLFSVESHYATYDKGDYYKLHLDSFVGRKNRVISMVIYLNKDWQEEDGGLLNIYKNINSNNPIATIMPIWGTVVLFLSEHVPHEVTVAKKKRYSIASWFRCNGSNHLI
jgi:SM-20-related protein